jgi:tetratricopeptide (TPR) repeat protein
MRRSSSKRAAQLVAAAACLVLAGSARADALAEIEERVDSWHLAEARTRARASSDELESSPRGRYVLGKLLFSEGDYEGALAELRRAIEGARAELGWKALRDLAADAEPVFARLTSVTGASGRFLYRHAAGVDALLVPYADELLTRQLDALAEELGDRPPWTIEVDILPDIESLAAVTGLTVEQIERTGTVAVTKFGRVMIISPKGLATGYPWLDTLAHELTHLIVTRVSGGRAPIWLHEGVAKLLERRWRGERLGALTPEEAYLLDRAAREGRLIPLRRFHPSVAFLPNQEDAALAYAQVLSLMRYLEDKLGEGWIRGLLGRLAGGASVDSAFVELSKFPLRRLYLWWKQSVAGRRQTPVPAISLLKRRFRRGVATAAGGGDESLFGVDVRRHLRVGDLLRLRGHVAAAVSEYRHAASLLDSPSPEISDRLAGCLLELEETATVIELLEPLAALYPNHPTLFVQLGEALVAEGRPAEAATALETANSINPFHPAVHCNLKEIYEKLGRSSEAAREGENCRLLARRSAPRKRGSP